MNKKVILFASWLLGLLSLAACNKTEDVLSGIEYVPFQMEKDGRWGMVSLDGEILYEDEFDSQPTFAVNGRFAVKNSNGMWEIYATEKPPRKIGEEYVSVSSFGPGVALVTRGKNKGIELIDRDGNVKCALNEVVGKSVDMAIPLYFMRGANLYFSPFVVFGADKKVGCMDAEGRVVIPPEYSWITYSGKYLMAFKGRNLAKMDWDYVESLFFLGAYITEDGDTLRTCVFDRTGNRLRAFTTVGESMTGWLSDEIIYVGKYTDEKLRCELRTPDNEVLLKLPSGVISMPAFSMSGDKFVFWDENSEHYGLMNMAGDMLIRDKYGEMMAVSDNLYVVCRGDDDVNLVDEKDNLVGNMTFKSVMFNGDRKILVEEEENSYCFIDHAGRKTGDKTFYNVSVVSGGLSMVVKSDYIDLTGLLDTLNIRKDGIDKFSLQMSAMECAQQTYKKDCSDYENTSSISTVRYLNSCVMELVVSFPEDVCQTGITFAPDWYGNYQEVYGDKFTTTRPECVVLSFRNTGKLKGKADLLFEAAKPYIKKLGKRVTRDEDNVLICELGSGRVAAVLKNKNENNVILYIGAVDRFFELMEAANGE